MFFLSAARSGHLKVVPWDTTTRGCAALGGHLKGVVVAKWLRVGFI